MRNFIFRNFLTAILLTQLFVQISGQNFIVAAHASQVDQRSLCLHVISSILSRSPEITSEKLLEELLSQPSLTDLVPAPIAVALRTEIKNDFNILNHRKIKIEIPQIAEYFAVRLKNSQTAGQFQESPVPTYEQILKDYEVWFKHSHLDFIHEKKGEDYLGLYFIEHDFIQSFGAITAHNKVKWDEKIKRWYDPTLIMRGLSYRSTKVSESEILQMFFKFHPQFFSNATAYKVNASTPVSQVRGLMTSEAKCYNAGLINGEFEIMAMDHTRAGPLYGQSYGYSCSLDYKVAKAFAMGAMVIADYGKQQDFQHLLKSRVVVGMYKAKKDVPMNRLKQLRPGFSSKYPRQQEIMGIGGADPDSVMFVHLIGPDGNVEKSYVRDTSNPQNILIYEGADIQNSNLATKPPTQTAQIP